jgi:hypothetical protein
MIMARAPAEINVSIYTPTPVKPTFTAAKIMQNTIKAQYKSNAGALLNRWPNPPCLEFNEMTAPKMARYVAGRNLTKGLPPSVE